jgi:hypothetical protein
MTHADRESNASIAGALKREKIAAIVDIAEVELEPRHIVVESAQRNIWNPLFRSARSCSVIRGSPKARPR